MTNESEKTRYRDTTPLARLPLSKNAAAHVSVDGRLYASFVDLVSAYDAVRGWKHRVHGSDRLWWRELRIIPVLR